MYRGAQSNETIRPMRQRVRLLLYASSSSWNGLFGGDEQVLIYCSIDEARKPLEVSEAGMQAG